MVRTKRDVVYDIRAPLTFVCFDVDYFRGDVFRIWAIVTTGISFYVGRHWPEIVDFFQKIF